MKTKALLLIAFTFIFWVKTKAQQIEPCGTMQLLEQLKAKDPALQKRMDSLEQVMQEWIKKNGFYRIYNNAEYPAIPGFIKTGDPKIDAVNFAKVKQDFYKTNPEEYRKLVSEMSKNKRTDKTIEEKREKIKQEKLNKK